MWASGEILKVETDMQCDDSAFWTWRCNNCVFVVDLCKEQRQIWVRVHESVFHTHFRFHMVLCFMSAENVDNNTFVSGARFSKHVLTYLRTQ